MRRLAQVTMVLLLTSGCASHHFSPGQEKPFRYKPPAGVSDVDRRDCESQAMAAARNASHDLLGGKGVAGASALLGPIFVLGMLGSVGEAEERAYEKTFRACLDEKGYKQE